MREVSVYVHIPFCVRKCYYCDFFSAPADDKLKQDYIKALLRQIEMTEWEGRIIKSIFIGGGTPSVLPSFSIGEIVQKLEEKAPFAPDCEISVEVNPGTVNREKLRRYREYGVNRLSIGLQSADDRELKTLGRIHRFADFARTFEAAREEGFQNLNIDLISSIPGQSAESFRRTLQKAAVFSPEHMSVYSLILEEGTEFYRRREELVFPDEDTVLEMDEFTREYLAENNYMRYEISNYAKAGMECRHNCVYWRRGTYLGFGAGASSLIEEREVHKRYTVLCDVKEYTERMLAEAFSLESIVTEEQDLSKEERMEEFMYLGLRMTEGISAKQFRQDFGVPLREVYGEILDAMRQKGLMDVRGTGRKEIFFLTERGLDLSNIVMAEFLLT